MHINDHVVKAVELFQSGDFVDGFLQSRRQVGTDRAGKEDHNLSCAAVYYINSIH